MTFDELLTTFRAIHAETNVSLADLIEQQIAAHNEFIAAALTKEQGNDR